LTARPPQNTINLHQNSNIIQLRIPAPLPIGKARWRQHVLLKQRLMSLQTILRELKTRLKILETLSENLERTWQKENAEIEAALMAGAEIEDGGRIK